MCEHLGVWRITGFWVVRIVDIAIYAIYPLFLEYGTIGGNG